MTTPELLELADLFVLGLVDPAEAEALERRLEIDPDWRAAVGAARDRFVPLDLAAPVLAPSPALWGRIDAALGTAPGALPPLPDSRAARRSDPRPAPSRAGGWRIGALAGAAASVLLALALGWQMLGDRPQVIAVLLDQTGQPLVLVEDFDGTRARITALGDLDVPEGRVLQVWTKPDEATGPVSLGLLRRAVSATLDDPARPLPAPRPDQLYEITLEEAPLGSPTGRPTGPILVKGFAKEPR